MSDLSVEVAVIGAGSAGYAAARRVAAGGLQTALVEGGAELGGLCILRGCMPTKVLLHTAEVLHQAQRAALFGLNAHAAGFDFAAVMARKDQLIAEFAAYRSEQLLTGKFQLIRARARFVDPGMVALSTGGVLRARHFILCTGSVVAPSPVPGLSEVGFLTSDDALGLKQLPKSLIILGGGSVAVEFAQFFARFGVEVSLVQRSAHVLREHDLDTARVLETVFRRERIQLFTDTRLLKAWREGEQKAVAFEHGGQTVRLAADEIFFGLGRVPNTEGLHLEAARVSVEHGRILTTLDMRTSAAHIYAAGDCTGLHEIVHLAIQQAEVAADNILRPQTPRRMDYRLLTSVVFSDPQVASVGLTEKAATAMNLPYLAASYLFADHGKSILMEARDGFVKLLAAPATGEILGGGVIGPMGGELIHEIVAAMAGRMTVQELAAMPHYHPTLAEIWSYPAEELADRIALAS
jgi:pyruvate/2-oxoglutarate dehydrogenase complex dihydrolipoamide dehydrogenase (E3) component